MNGHTHNKNLAQNEEPRFGTAQCVSTYGLRRICDGILERILVADSDVHEFSGLLKILLPTLKELRECEGLNMKFDTLWRQWEAESGTSSQGEDGLFISEHEIATIRQELGTAMKKAQARLERAQPSQGNSNSL